MQIRIFPYGDVYKRQEQKHNSYSHACLPDTSAILLWLGQKVIDGVIWDLFKVAAKKLYEKFVKSNSYLSEKLSKFLSDEQDLKRFYTYVKEFNEQNMTCLLYTSLTQIYTNEYKTANSTATC